MMTSRLPLTGTLRLCSCIGIRSPAKQCKLLPSTGGARRSLSTTSTTPPGMSQAQRAMVARAEANESIARYRAERETSSEAEKNKTLWSYVKGAKQSLFNMGLAMITIMIAGNMLQRRVQREKIEKELLEVKRQQSVLIGALANEEWAEGAAKRIGATSGKEGLLRELDAVVCESMKDEETLQRAALEVAAKESPVNTASSGPGIRGMV